MKPGFFERLYLLRRLGPISAFLGSAVLLMQSICLMLLSHLRPASDIDICPDFSHKDWLCRLTEIEPLPISDHFLEVLAKKRQFVMNGKSAKHM